MESTPLIPLWPSVGRLGLARAELSEVFCCAWDGVGEELHLDSAERLAAEGHVEEADGVAVGEESV